MIDAIHANEVDLRRFFETLDSHLENPDLSDDYREKILIMKSEDIC